jgi:2-polyprenyl-3-methyl-5-hydroxy-6-metoxy-1,4-benzoquinol methylase
MVTLESNGIRAVCHDELKGLRPMTEPYVRAGCPICSESASSYLCRMGKEYLETGPSGWKHDPEHNKLAGLDFVRDKDAGTSYVECSGCGTFYLDVIYPVEESFAVQNGRDGFSDKGMLSSSPFSIYNHIQRTESNAALVGLAMESTGSSSLSVLDYGCGGGSDLSILKALQVRNVVGYNVRDYMFPAIRSHMQPGIRLIDSRSELGEIGPFDAIRCNAVLEHVEEPNVVLDDVFELLRPRGVAFFYAPSVSRKVMRAYSRNVDEGRMVKRLHEGHLQIWNRDTLPLSKYVANRGFEIVPHVGGVRHRDIINKRQAVHFAAAHAARIKFIIGATIGSMSGRYNASSFFAIKPE